jgi:hypothetical protein
MTAIGRSCPYPERAGCIGCGFEILTKSALHLLTRELEGLKRLREKVADGEAWRYTAILNSVVEPAIDELILCAKALSPYADAPPLREIAERKI